MGEYYALMANDKIYEATAVILATGVNFGKPLKGEEQFLGKRCWVLRYLRCTSL